MPKLFVGCVGVGKSTLINSLNGNHDSRVSHSQFEDGTTAWMNYGQYIDTPGLDSKNVKWDTIHDKVEKYGNNFQICLLLDANMGRASTFIHHFDRLLNEFTNPRFYIIWLRGNPSLEKRNEWKSRYTGQLVEQLIAPEQAAEIRKGGTEVMLKPRNLPVVLATPPRVIPTLSPKPQVIQQSFGNTISVFKGFITIIGRESNQRSSADLASRFLASSNTCAIVSRVLATNNPEVQQMRLIGDCVLKFLVFLLVLANRQVLTGLSEFIQPLIKNDGFIEGFFTRYLQRFVPANTPALNDHSKGDCVEAVLAYSLFGDDSTRKRLNDIPQLLITEIDEELNRMLKNRPK
jgi:hypothetical protein